MTDRANWLVFLALGFMWGSSYLFIKLAVDDFGVFTLVALRLAVGAALLWAVLRIARQPVPKRGRIYGHLFVMSIFNIALPFALITWAEQSVESALAAVITSMVPLFTAVIAPLFIHDEPLRVNGIAGLGIGFAGVLILTGRNAGDPGSDLASEIALVGSSVSYAVGAVYARRHVRGLAPMIPATFQVTFALLVTASIALVLERPWDARPDLEAVFSIVWLGVLGSGLAYLAAFRLLAVWGATRMTMVAYLIPIFGIALGAIVLNEAVDARMILGTALIVGGIALVSAPFGRRTVFARTAPV